MPIAMKAAEAPSPAAPAPRQSQGRGDHSAGLFLPVESDRVASVAPSDRRLGSPASGITTVRSRLVRVAADELAQTRASIEGGTPVELTLHFFDDAVFQVIFEETLVTWTGGYSLLGRLAGTSEYGGTAALVVSGSVVRGTVRTAGGTYEVEAMEDGVHVIRQIDLSRRPALGDDTLRSRDVPDHPEDAPLSSHSRRIDESSHLPCPSECLVDVLVVYTPQARRDLGGSLSVDAARARMVEKIETSVADTNSALFVNNATKHRIRLVFVEETNYFSERANTRLTLDAFRDNGTVNTLRNLYSADLVHLIVRNDILNADGEPICGTAHIGRYAGLTKASCLSPDLTFAHELGHNFGLSHDPYQLLKDDDKPYYSDGQGYVHIGRSVEQSFRTIMAYSTQCRDTFDGRWCSQVPRFSDPHGHHAGVPIGDFTSSNAVRVVRASDTSYLRDPSGKCAHNLMNIFPGMGAPGYRNGVNGFYTCPSGARNGSYSKYYTFAPKTSLRYTIDLSSRSGNDTYLYIRHGGPYGSVLYQDDNSGPSTDARLTVTLPMGRTYTIEATTYSGGRNDEFVLGLATASTAPPPPPPPTNRCTLEDFGVVSTGITIVARTGTLGGDCVSPNYSGRLARYYSFRLLGGAADVTIDMSSSNVDSWLALRRGANIRGARLTSNNDGGTGRNARISRRLEAGTYTIEATSAAPRDTGTFTMRLIVAPVRVQPPVPPGRTTPPTLDLTCHGYDEGATRAYNCIPVPSQQRHMRTFVPAVGSACDQGSIAEFPAGRIVFQIRCRDGSLGQSAAWWHSGQGPGFFVTPIGTPRVWVRTSFLGSSVQLSVWCRAPQENLVVNELLGTSWGNDGTSGIYGMAGCREVEVDTAGEDLQWWFTEELAATALTPPRSWEQVTGADRALPTEALQDLATAAELERRWRQLDRWGMNPGQGASTRGAVLTSDDYGGTRRDLRSASGSDDGPDALDGAPLRSAVRTSPLTLDLTCHGYNEGAARGTRAYNCIPVPSQQRYMRTFVPAVGSACDRGSIAEFPAGRIVFQIRCRDGSSGQSGSWSYSGQGPALFEKPIDTPRVGVRTSFSGSSVHLSVWCRAPQEHLVVNELLGTSWGNDGTNGIYGLADCSEVEVDTGGQDLQWWFTQDLAATALTPPRSWEQATGADRALPAEARQDLATAAELERLWSRPGR